MSIAVIVTFLSIGNFSTPLLYLEHCPFMGLHVSKSLYLFLSISECLELVTAQWSYLWTSLYIHEGVIHK